MATKAFAPAKINLTLHVTGRRDDGYHLLDSLVAFADIGDRITVEPAGMTDLIVTGPMARGVPVDDSNLVLRAAALAKAPPLAITLEKHLPAAAGIGGGSSDAAAVLRAIADLTGTPVPEDALRLGADVPVCLRATATRMSGIGETLTPVPPLPELWAVLANPRVAVPTPKVFAALRQRINPAMPATIPAFADARSLVKWLKTQRNDLEAAAISLSPVIADVLGALQTLPGSLMARMSGSGATCFALFDTEEAAQDAAELLAMTRSDWWSAAARLS
ncbi:4-(cytidine 5'-diphospho)-2-C-methyl-D-erythritol kinase [Actibacterium sp.]|uniref:4-(cytidine 5'-diphospho)-2-C-methyl-D-erythritol kinase n=1 Tax=Actibacterium sp. TaxID=1872125 RepID=UPI00356580CB